MTYLLTSLYILGFVVLIFNWNFFRVKGISRKYIAGVFLLKIAVGVFLAWIYTDHYTSRRTGDAFRFYDDAVIMHSSLESGIDTYLKLITGIGLKEDAKAMDYYWRMTHLEKPYYNGFLNDNATIIRVNAIVLNFSRGVYHVHTVFWCFFSLAGLTALLKLLITYFPRKKWAVFLSVYLLPTVLFWSSGVLKEPLLLLGMGLFLSGFFKFIYNDYRTIDILQCLLGFLILLVAKGYVLQCMAPGIFGLLLAKAFDGRKFAVWFSIPHLLIIPLVFIGPLISDGLKVAELMKLKQEAFYNVATMSDSGSVIEIPEIQSPVDLFLNAPEALMITFLRPWPWEWTKLLFIPAALENLFLILALAVMIWNFRRPYGLAVPILAFSASFILILGVLTGQVVPVMGALVRYKLPALIFLFILIFGLTDHVKLQKRIPILRKLIRKL